MHHGARRGASDAHQEVRRKRLARVWEAGQVALLRTLKTVRLKGLAHVSIPSMPSLDSKTVTFRVSGVALERLNREAEAFGLSRSERARQIVIGALENEFERELLAGQREMDAALQRLREDVARTLVSVMDTLQTDPQTGERRYPFEEVEAMVRKYLG